MKISTIIVLGIVLACVVADGTLSYNSSACDVLTNKFGAAEKTSAGTNANARHFGGSVTVTEAGDAVVKVFYEDGDLYYSNKTTFGFVTEDGKAADTTCLDLRVLKYGADFTNPQNVTDLTIGKEQDDVTQYRYYVLTFKGSEFSTRLIQTESAEYYTYTGNYALQFKLSQTNPWRTQYTHRFTFSLRVKRSTTQIVDTSFNQISSSSTANCASASDPTCTIVANSELLFCKNEACTDLYTTAPIIYLNDFVFMLHRTKTSNLQSFKYSNSVITFIADGLLKNATLAAVVYNPGNATYKFKAPLAWTNLKIQASTQLVSTSRLLESNLRLLAETSIGESAIGTSDTTCVQVDSSSTECPTCAAICSANDGDAPSVCACSGSSGYLLLASFLLALLMF